MANRIAELAALAEKKYAAEMTARDLPLRKGEAEVRFAVRDGNVVAVSVRLWNVRGEYISVDVD